MKFYMNTRRVCYILCFILGAAGAGTAFTLKSIEDIRRIKVLELKLDIVVESNARLIERTTYLTREMSRGLGKIVSDTNDETISRATRTEKVENEVNALQDLLANFSFDYSNLFVGDEVLIK